MADLSHTEYALRKKAHMQKSLMGLMAQRRYSEISVTDICREASVPRRTFYNYFESKEDILDSIIEDMMHQSFLVVMSKLRSGKVRESFVQIFRFWQGENCAKLNILLENGLESRLMSWSLKLLRTENLGLLSDSDMEPKMLEIGLMVGVTSFFSLLFYWSRGNYRETPEEMAQYAVHMLPQAFSHLINARAGL